MDAYDYIKFLQDNGISIDADSGKNRNFLGLPCPYCDNSSKLYGGINTVKNYYTCFKCGSHDINTVLQLLTGKNWRFIKKDYKTNLDARDLYLKQVEEREIPTELKWPLGTSVPNDRQKKYLESRGYDPYELIENYGLKGTGNYGQFSHRIVIPIYFDRMLVSWTCRDYTGLAELRYMSCKKKDEIIHHKDIVYGIDTVPGDHVIIVEGPTDKWRMGLHAVAMFGTGFKMSQVNVLKRFKKATILFDEGEDAQGPAEELGGLLAGTGIEVDMILLSEGDPGILPQDEADDLVRIILGGQ